MSNIEPCKKCGHKLLTCHTYVSDWAADQEPYISNVNEGHDGFYESVYISAQYCEKCEAFDDIYFEAPMIEEDKITESEPITIENSQKTKE